MIPGGVYLHAISLEAYCVAVSDRYSMVGIRLRDAPSFRLNRARNLYSLRHCSFCFPHHCSQLPKTVFVLVTVVVPESLAAKQSPIAFALTVRPPPVV
jgi:hypothetical protein